MPARLDAATLLSLTLPPLLWASNAIIGRYSVSGGEPLVSPFALNAARWAVALAVLLAIATVKHWRGGAPASGAAPVVAPEAGGDTRARPARWLVYAVIGLLSVTSYNTLQYLALRTTTAINVTLIASSGPLWMLIIGRLLFGERGSRWAWIGAMLSLAGVLVVLSGGDPARLVGLRLAPGDLYVLLAVVAWTLFSWLLRRYRPADTPLVFMIGQVGWGLLLMAPLLAGEWAVGQFVLRADPRTAAVIAWVALGPSLLAYWCWDRGVARAGPVLAMFFANLMPLAAALMSAALLGEPPGMHHALAFALIVGGIVLSQRRPG